MIGWKCDYGYYTNPGGKPPANISDIVFTDKNSVYTFITNFNGFEKYDGITDNISTSYIGINYATIIDFQNALESAIGDDFYYLYFHPMLGNNSGLTENNFPPLSAPIPSAFKACPNLFQYYYNEYRPSNNDQSRTWPCMYLSSLRKMIYGSRVYNVAQDGSLSIIFNNPSNANNFPVNRVNTIQYQKGGPVWAAYWLCPSFDGSAESLWSSPYYSLQVSYREDPIQVKIAVNRAGNNNDARGFLQALFTNYVPPDGNNTTPINPYEPANPSAPGTLPPGTFDPTSDPIEIPSLPTLSAANTGFTRIYNPTLSQVQQLAKYLWTDDSIVDTIWNHLKQFFEDPMQAMIGFNLLPCPIPDGGTEEFALMYIGTGVNMTVAANQFVDVDCGTLALERYYGSALDQSPYTKVTAFLPYIGMVQLDTDEIMGTTLQVKYRIDIVSGSCVAYILVDGNALYQYSGHCAINIPFASADFSSYVSAAINVAKLGVGMITAGAAGLAASLVPEPESQTGRTVTRTEEVRKTARNPETGRQVTQSVMSSTINYQYNEPEQRSQSLASMAGLTPANISNTVGQIMSSKPSVQHSGSFSGNSGYLGVRRPYLIIERPNMCLPANYQSMNGYPSMITMTLGDCVGYTRVQQVQLTGMWATNPEQAEILQLLKSGVVF